MVVCHGSVAEHRQLKPGVLGSISSDCRPFHFILLYVCLITLNLLIMSSFARFGIQITKDAMYRLDHCSSVQILNLVNAIENKKTPWELVNMPPVVVKAVKRGRTREFIQRFRDRTPFFKGC